MRFSTKAILVEDNNKVAGIVTRHDVIEYVTR